MDDQRLHICYVCKQREELQIVDELLRILCTTLDLEGEDRTTTVREVLLVQCLLFRIIGYRRMMNLLYKRMLVQILNDFQCVLHILSETESQDPVTESMR